MSDYTDQHSMPPWNEPQQEPEAELPNAILGAAADLRRAHYHHAAENLVATIRNLIEQKEKAERERNQWEENIEELWSNIRIYRERIRELTAVRDRLCTEHVKVEVTEEAERAVRAVLPLGDFEIRNVLTAAIPHLALVPKKAGEAESVEGEVIAGFRIVSDPNIPAGEIHFRTQKGGRPVVHKITGITLWTPTPGGDDDDE